jgi:hypothetical protein
MSGCAGVKCEVREISIELKHPIGKIGGTCPDETPLPSDDEIIKEIEKREKDKLAPSGCEDPCVCVKNKGATPDVIEQEKTHTFKVPGPHHCEWELRCKYVVTTRVFPGRCGANGDD